MKKYLGALYLGLGAACLAAGVYAAVTPEVGTTLDNLNLAYIAEVNTMTRYAAYARKADREGYAGIASLFRAISQSEKIHAANHAKVIEGMGGKAVAELEKPVVRSTLENLSWVVAAENDEYGAIYPAYVRQAIKDNNQAAVRSFNGAMACEGAHAWFFSQAGSDPGHWKKKRAFLVCSACGYTTARLKVSECPSCAGPREQFREYE